MSSASTAQEAADRKRDESMEGLKRLILRTEEGSPRRAALLHQLAELSWEKARALRQRELARLLEQQKAADERRRRGETVAEPRADHRESELYRAETIRLLEQVASEQPQYERTDEVLFALGQELYAVGRRAEAVARYRALVEGYPRSRLLPDVFVELGNHYFDIAGQLAEARAMYERAAAAPSARTRSYALYKLAWCDLNAGDAGRARERFEAVVAQAEGQKGLPSAERNPLAELKTEALAGLVRAFAQLDGPDEAVRYFGAHATDSQRTELLTALVRRLAEAGKHESAISLARRLLVEAPLQPGAPELQQAVVKGFEALRQRDAVRTEARLLAQRYSPGSEWWRSHASATPVRRRGFAAVEETLRNLVTATHQEAQSTRKAESYRLAKGLYRDYLDAFASSKQPDEVSDWAFNLSFFNAEILFALEEWDEAARAYDGVVRFAVPDRPSAREIAQEPYRERAAYSALLAYERLLAAEKQGGVAPALSDGARVEERRDKGVVAGSAKVQRGEVGGLEAQPLTPAEQRFVEACDTYVRLFPGRPDELEVRYRAGTVLYERNRFVEAAARFSELVRRWPEDARARQAAERTLAFLEQRKEWLELHRTARQFHDDVRLCRPGSEFERRVQRVVEGALYRWIDEVVLRQERAPARAGAELLRWADAYPSSPLLDRALLLALEAFDEAGLLRESLGAGERLVKARPASPLLARALPRLARLEASLLRLESAARYAEASLPALDALQAQAARRPAVGSQASGEIDLAALLVEARGQAPDLLHDAALWWEALDQPERARALFAQYEQRFGERSDAPEVAWTAVGLELRARRWPDAVTALERFLRQYAKDARVPPERRFEARYQLLRARLAVSAATGADGKAKGGAAAHRAELKALLAAHKGLSEGARASAPVQEAHAHLRLLALEELWEAFAALRLEKPARLRAELELKAARLADVEKGYSEVLMLGAGEPSVAALVRIAQAHADFARRLAEAPEPRGLDGQELELYRSALQEKVAPFEEKAVEGFRRAVAKCHELSFYGSWLAAAQEGLERQRPGTFLEVRGLEPASREPVATGDGACRVAELGADAPVGTWVAAAVACRAAGRSSEAERAWHGALEKDRAQLAARKGLVRLYREAGRLRLAEWVALEALAKSPRDGELLSELGLIHGRLGEWAQAAARWREAAAVEPKRFEPHFNLGTVLLRHRDYEGAAAAFSRARSLDDGSAVALRGLAHALDGQRSLDPRRGLEAGALFEKVLAAQPDDRESLCAAGWAYAAERSGWQKAAGLLERCLASSADVGERSRLEAKLKSLELLLRTAAPKPAPSGAVDDAGRGGDGS